MSGLLGTLRTTEEPLALLLRSGLSCYTRSCLPRSHCYTRSRLNHDQRVASFHSGRQSAASKVSDPLRVLFCGSDNFSCASLAALHQEHQQNPKLIQSIDVVVRPGKRTGRGHKVFQDPPIRSLASHLGLRIHERDTFTGWSMPDEINLIIAVSFGLFVPPRLLRAAKYGGLNVHPSLLPDLRGPAPLQHTLLLGRSLTGVSLQTLDHKVFDQGVVLAQTPADPEHVDALRIPDGCTTVPQLQTLVTPVAARMLVQGLRDGLHVPPLEDRGWKPDAEENATLVHAPKITKQDRQVSLSVLRACDSEDTIKSRKAGRGTLIRRHDAIGPLWFWSRNRQGMRKRIIIEELEELPGCSLVNRPSMTGKFQPSCPSTSHMYHEPSSIANQPDRTSCHWYIVPFEEGEQAVQDDDSQLSSAGINLAFWSADDSFPLGDQKLERSASEVGEICLGNYRVLKLKVEGEKAKPARLALDNFITEMHKSIQS
ncbi:Formyltransferase [Xylariaceae sp. FL1651]|nr:Formyltransferase [Xylariaceae sp. FL1651]